MCIRDSTTRDAYLALDVYKTDDGKATTLYVKGNDYAEEDWVLVNVNDAKDVSIIRTTNKAAQTSDLVEIVAKACLLYASGHFQHRRDVTGGFVQRVRAAGDGGHAL